MPESTKELLLESALSLIDEVGGCRGVTLRSVASKAGCAHTNAYNYFPSLENLFWEAVMEANWRNAKLRDDYIAKAGSDPMKAFEALVDAQLDFALTHPGWYRLIWLENFNGEIPESFLPRIVQSWAVVGSIMGRLLDGLSPDNVGRVTDIIHTYIHGEICRIISKRDAIGGVPADVKQIKENALRLLRVLKDDHSAIGRTIS